MLSIVLGTEYWGGVGVGGSLLYGISRKADVKEANMEPYGRNQGTLTCLGMRLHQERYDIYAEA